MLHSPKHLALAWQPGLGQELGLRPAHGRQQTGWRPTADGMEADSRGAEAVSLTPARYRGTERSSQIVTNVRIPP